MTPSTNDQTLGVTPAPPLDGTWQLSFSISQLLYHAAWRVWARVDAEGPAAALHSLGLGIYLAHAHVHQALPADYDVADTNGFDEDRTAVQMLTEAEDLSRHLPPVQADLVHGPDLVVDLGDLIREAQHHDC